MKMIRNTFLVAGVAILLAACGQKDDAASEAESAMDKAAEATGSAMDEAADAAKDAAGSAMQEAEDMANEAMDAAGDVIDEAMTLSKSAYASQAGFELETERVFKARWMAVRFACPVPDLGRAATLLRSAGDGGYGMRPNWAGKSGSLMSPSGYEQT